MVPFEWYTSFIQTLVVVGMALGTMYYVVTRRAFKLFFYSIMTMLLGSLSTLVPVFWISYPLYIIGHIGVGMFIVSLLFILLKLVKMVADTVPLSVREL